MQILEHCSWEWVSRGSIVQWRLSDLLMVKWANTFVYCLLSSILKWVYSVDYLMRGQTALGPCHWPNLWDPIVLSKLDSVATTDNIWLVFAVRWHYQKSSKIWSPVLFCQQRSTSTLSHFFTRTCYVFPQPALTPCVITSNHSVFMACCPCLPY